MTIPPSTDSPLPLPRRLWWPWDEVTDHVVFRRTFSLGRDALATVSLVSSGPVRVWLGEQELTLRGQPLPTWRTTRHAQVRLPAGEHCLEVEARGGGHGQPFVLASLDWQNGDTAGRIATDDTWTMTRDPHEDWRATRGPLHRPAWAFDGVWGEPWGFPCDAPDDFLRLTTGWQTVRTGTLDRVVAMSPGLLALGAGVDASDARRLTFRPARPVPEQGPVLDPVRRHDLWQYAREAHAIATNDWLDIFEARAPHVVLDVGEETFARVKVTSRTPGTALLAVTTGESLGEVEHHGRRLTDVITLREGETFATCPTGFRYVKLVALASDGDIVLDPVEVQHVRFGAEVTGAFECSDDTINRVWRVATHTALLCMQNELWDGIKRDQRPWMGDLHVEALVSYHLLSDTRLVARTLGVLGELGPAPAERPEWQRYPGLSAGWKTTTGDINDIPSYTLWWVVGLHDYHRYTGDLTLIEEVAGALDATLKHVSNWTDEHGRWRFHTGWDLVDWAPLTAGERELYCHLLATRALRDGAALLTRLGRPATTYATLAGRMRESARAELLPRLHEHVPHHLAAICILSGVLDDAEAQAVFGASLADDPNMTMTFWHRFNDLQAAAHLGQVQWGLDYLRHHWGTMLSLGATTFWEAFDPAWVHAPDPHAVSIIAGEHAQYGGYGTSLCHGWSAGPTAWLSGSVLGVTPAEAGWRTAHFRPNLGDLRWARGRVPTPLGDVQVDLRAEPEGLFATLVLPEGLALEVGEDVQATWSLTVERVEPKVVPVWLTGAVLGEGRP
ncbi:alpha-L-rhamnosidase C-terminal domain-containing protein [Deinococcus sp. YIM 134068]|uniref:alpha-L-rhamnosidase-related protein n=1 Tax=Deinococcus lichenicola TaxID=3118910 RepID=UPI002F95CDEF